MTLEQIINKWLDKHIKDGRTMYTDDLITAIREHYNKEREDKDRENLERLHDMLIEAEIKGLERVMNDMQESPAKECHKEYLTQLKAQL